MKSETSKIRISAASYWVPRLFIRVITVALVAIVFIAESVSANSPDLTKSVSNQSPNDTQVQSDEASECGLVPRLDNRLFRCASGDETETQPWCNHPAGAMAASPDSARAQIQDIHNRIANASSGHAGRTAGGGETWTILFYDDVDFNGYNPLYDFAAEAYSGDHLQVLVLEDRRYGPASIWYVEEDHSTTQLEDWGEVNMADASTLRDFLDYGKTNFPADHYLLAVYDHGMGWEGACIDVTSDDDWLTMDEFQQAFTQAGGVDIICFAAPCLMGALESVYELRDSVSVYVGSEALSGYVYWRPIFGELCDILNTPPQPSNIEIGEEIIRLIDEHNTSQYDYGLTMSAVRTDRISEVAAQMDLLSGHLRQRLETCTDHLSFARCAALHFSIDVWENRPGWREVDLRDFIHEYTKVESDPVILEDLQNVMNAFDQAVIAECNGSIYDDAHGLTLYFPSEDRYFNPNYRTASLDFIEDTEWDELLVEFYQRAPVRTIVAGPGPGPDNPPLLRTFSVDVPGTCRYEWQTYGVPSYGVNVAAGDLFGGHTDVIVTGPGPGAVFGPHVRAFTSFGMPIAGVNLLAYGTHKYGVNVAVGNINGGWPEDIITGAGPGRVFGPHVRAWNFNADNRETTAIPEVSFLAYGTNRYGVNVASGDIDGDWFHEIVTGPGPGAVFGPHVRAWNYDLEDEVAAIPEVSFFAYGTHKFGVNVCCGDLDGDQVDEIITGPGPGTMFGAHVRGWNFDGTAVTAMPGVNFFAYSPCRCGVSMAATDLDLDGIDEIITAPGPHFDQSARIRVWNVDGGSAQLMEAVDFDAYPEMGLGYGGTVAGGRM